MIIQTEIRLFESLNHQESNLESGYYNYIVHNSSTALTFSMFFVLAFDFLFPLRFEFHLPIYLKYFIIYVIFSHRQQQRENLRQFKLNSLLVTLAFFHCVTTLPGNVSFVMWTIFPEVYSKFDGRYFSMRLLHTTY